MKAPRDQTGGGELAFLSALNRYIEINIVISKSYIIFHLFSNIYQRFEPFKGIIENQAVVS